MQRCGDKCWQSQSCPWACLVTSPVSCSFRMSIKLQTAVLQCTWCQDWWPLVQLMRAISGKLGCSVLVTNDPDRGTTQGNNKVKYRSSLYEKVAVGSKNQSWPFLKSANFGNSSPRRYSHNLCQKAFIDATEGPQNLQDFKKGDLNT